MLTIVMIAMPLYACSETSWVGASWGAAIAKPIVSRTRHTLGHVINTPDGLES